MTAEQIHEVRRLIRLEALRSAVFSVASESLDAQTPRLVVSIELDGDTLAAQMQFCAPDGSTLAGGAL